MYNAEAVSIDDCSFYENSGWQHSKGAAAFLYSDSVSVKNSKFTNNLAGHHGTALDIEYCKQVEIFNNDFIENGPVTSMTEQIYNTPYYNFLLNRNHTSVYFDTRDDCQNEFAYFENCASEEYKIQMAVS